MGEMHGFVCGYVYCNLYVTIYIWHSFFLKHSAS